jgi:hypothetical protein
MGLDVLDSDTTHFDCLIEIRGREKREALESCRVCCDLEASGKTPHSRLG